jgi:excinuclease ABC subunit B
VLLYADQVTDSMQRLLDVTAQRRAKQIAYNTEHGITPRTVVKAIQESLGESDWLKNEAEKVEKAAMMVAEGTRDYDIHEVIRELEGEMVAAARALEYERAAMLRDQIAELRAASEGGAARNKPVRYAQGKPAARTKRR